mgnify:FL=1
MSTPRPYKGLIDRLNDAGVRPTRQRLALAKLLFEKAGGAPYRHVTAEQLHGEAMAADVRVSLATIYNTLHQFTQAGLLRELVVEPGQSMFDTNIDDHHHFYHESNGTLEDIPGDGIEVVGIPAAPDGSSVKRIDVIVRLSDSE